MAVTLKIGRFGMDATVTTDSLNSWRDRARAGVRTVQFTGIINEATKADADSLRTELLQQVENQQLIAITYSLDPILDGFYILTDADVRTNEGTYINNGLYEFRCEALRLGGESDVEVQSLVTAALLTNDHGLIASEVTFWHAAPPDTNAYNAGAGTPILHTRTSEGGEVQLYLDVAVAEDPTWSVAPGSYYEGAAYIETEGYLRAGLKIPSNQPADWELGNGLIRVRPQTFQSTSNGRINVARWDGAAYTTSFDFKIVRGANVIPGWNYMNVVRNSPEVCTIRLTRDADEGTPTAHRHVLDITLRRGSYMAYCYYTYTGAALGYTVERNTTDAGTAVTPTGATSAVGIQDSSGTERYLIASPEDHTADTTNGGLDFTSRTQVPFALGVAHSSDTHDTASDLCVQYLGWVSEDARGVQR